MKRFVKLTAFTFVCVFCLIMVLGCTKIQAEENSIPTTVIEVTPNERTYKFKQVPEEGQEIEGYREEYLKRIETKTLYNVEEVEFLKEKGFYIFDSGGYFRCSRYSDYSGTLITQNDPIIFCSDNGIEVWGVNSYGELYAYSIEGKTSNNRVDDYYGLIHYTVQEAEKNNEEIVFSNLYRVISYQPETGTVKHWEYGKLVKDFKVPANSVYVGSAGPGYLFQNGNDVWAVRNIYNDDERLNESEIIAHNVKYVITDSYELDSYAGYYPLFLMTDSSLKIYVEFEGKYEDPVDSESKLIEIKPEGEDGEKYIIDRSSN